MTAHVDDTSRKPSTREEIYPARLLAEVEYVIHRITGVWPDVDTHNIGAAMAACEQLLDALDVQSTSNPPLPERTTP